MSKFIIEDWMSNHVYKELTFSSFDDARDFISEVAHEECVEAGLTDGTDEYEELYNGVCEDLYAINTEDKENEN